MDDLRFHEEHNKVGFLSKGKKSEGFNDIVDFLRASTLAHAILLAPKIYIAHQKDFWRNARVETVNGIKMIQTTLCDRPLSVTESTIRRCLHLDDEGVCLATSRKFNFSNMIFQNLVSNLDPKSTSTAFYMYPRFVQEVINLELTDVPASGQTYNRNDPSFKMYSNMKRGGISTITPLFPTMMGVIPPTGEASGLQPTHTSIPSDDLPTPTTSNTPLTPVHVNPTPALKVYHRRIKGAPSSSGSKKPEPTSPLVEHSPLEFDQRETHGVSPNSNVKEVPSMEMQGHVDGVAHTTGVAQSVHQASVNISKTPSTATLNEKSLRGPRCQETKGVDSVSARLKTSTKIPKDPAQKDSTSKPGEGRLTQKELMDSLAAIAKDLQAHDAQFQLHDLKHDETATRMEILEKMVKTQHQLISDLYKKCQYQGAKIVVQNMHISALQRRYTTLAAFTKGEKAKVKGESKVKAEFVKATISEEKSGFEKTKETTPEAATEVNVDERVAAETLVVLPQATPEKKKAKKIPKEVEEAMSLKTIYSLMTPEELERAKKIDAEQEASIEVARKLQEEEDQVVVKKTPSKPPRSKPQSKKVQPKKVAMSTRQTSKTEERKGRIRFLVNVVGGTESMFSGWSDKKIQDRYKKEREAMQKKEEEKEEVEEMPLIQRRSKRKHDVPVVEEKEKEPEKEKEKEVEKEKVSEAEKEKDERNEDGSKQAEKIPEDATMEEGGSQPSEQQKTGDSKRKKSIAHKKFAKKLKLVHDSGSSEIIDWDAQEQDKQVVWMVESKGGKLDTYRSVYNMFSRMSIADLKKMYEIGCVKDPKGKVEVIQLIEDFKVMFAFEKSRDDYREKITEVTCEAFGGVGATAWCTFKRNRVASISFNGRQCYFLVDKRYDFDQVLCTSILRLMKKKSILSELEKEFIERINQRMMQFDDDFDPAEVGVDDGVEKRMKEWFVRDLNGRLYYKVIWEDGKACRGGILADILKVCSRENLREMYEMGMQLYGNILEEDSQEDIILNIKSALECLCWLFEPTKVANLMNQPCETVNEWRLFLKCGVYSLTINGMDKEYYFVDGDQVHDLPRMQVVMEMLEDLSMITAAVASALLYLAQCTRPDISFVVNCLARHSNTPTRRHWNDIKDIFCYLKGTTGMGLFYPYASSSEDTAIGTPKNATLVGYADAGYLSNPHKERSQSGYVFTIGNTAIS
ncbi:hypothetical protein OSB04_024991 [Centaurea solstitialis]|uniref:Reverse transcriptase Ty1/copia-type domain-containing protein n=1 Tax=Centaurea solstitialis TaxID=347529 RepID=A0AA38WCM2_9ASTR|nr:hypothetical protein OSB04_024991 [Centaurea solstitialis]